MTASTAITAPDTAGRLLPEIVVRRLYISPGHNFVGHHGRPPGTHPTMEVGEIECVAGRGIRGDRYFDHEKNYRGQITFFAAEVLADLRRELGWATDCAGAPRRNVITEGIQLNTLIGCEFEIQGVRFAGVEECRPCYWMNHAFQDERAEQFLKGRGGLRARILTSGVLGIHRDKLRPDADALTAKESSAMKPVGGPVRSKEDERFPNSL